MSNVAQFASVVTEAGAKALSIKRGPNGAERLIIQTPGGFITREVPLRGNLGKDIQEVMATANEIVANAKSLRAEPARYLSPTPGSKAAGPGKIY
jgi:hypothetical protein